MRRTVLTATLSLAVAAVLAACGSGLEASPTAGAAPSPAAAAPSAAPAGQTVPEQLRFTAKTLDGADFSGESLAGKAVVLWFWAPWCPKCPGEAPTVGAAAAVNAGAVTFVGVAALDELPAMQEFVRRYPVGGFSHLADLDASIWRRFGVTVQPAYAFIGTDGSVEVVKNQLSEAELTDRVRTLAGR